MIDFILDNKSDLNNHVMTNERLLGNWDNSSSTNIGFKEFYNILSQYYQPLIELIDNKIISQENKSIIRSLQTIKINADKIPLNILYKLHKLDNPRTKYNKTSIIFYNK